MFSDILCELMNEKSVSPQDIQNYLEGTSISKIYAWIEGRNIPLIDNLIKLADYFNCSIEYLIGRTQDVGNSNFKPAPPFDLQFKKILKEKKISQYRLLKDKVISCGNIDFWLNKKKIPSVSSIVKLADYLQVDIDYLLGRV